MSGAEGFTCTHYSRQTAALAKLVIIVDRKPVIITNTEFFVRSETEICKVATNMKYPKLE